ncbi:LOW QUALITY PROTEIN: cell division control protein 48 homolog C [Ananas comosus]|uniref:LOW QUALITY PROTEIN: cell division control protein 48 homolog C n=1 Tax=Ananas comosus TaxID=4615 RepID=A0A6P5GYE0_ANACO|nr:LOW QUALITY PROTEIN: cell division control protein 48 homolog C [Ananas comosus]
MGKRMRRGGGGGGGRRSPASSGLRLSGELRRRIAAAGLEGAAADVAADQLRSQYPEYGRIKLQPFFACVREALDSLSAAADDDSTGDEDDGGGGGTSSRKRPSRSDSSEQRLLRAEAEHLRRRRQIERPDPSDDSTSTSDDSVYEDRVDPVFDITKSMLRNSYSKKKPPIKPSRKQKDAEKEEEGEEDNMEIEVASEKPRRMATADGSGTETPVAEKSRRGGGGGGGEGENGWPRFRDLGGMKSVIEELMMEVIVPLCHPQLPRWLGVRPMAGILLHGPPGCGKTTLAHAIANETGVPFYKISAPEVVSGVSGASEENIRDLFKKAYRTAPSIVFIDEIDSIASKRENLQREMERRIVTQLMTCMDEFHQALDSGDANSDADSSEKKLGYVLVIGATNRPDAVDPALRRPGRFDREIALGVPDENARVEILSMLTRNLRLEGQFNLFKIARSTPGFVGADLKALVNKAGNLAMKRIIDTRKSQHVNGIEERNTEDWWRQPWDAEEMQSLSITMADFEEAARMVQPSLRREGFSSIPNVTWKDVGGLNSLRKEFNRYIVQRIKCPEDCKEYGLNMEAGFLLFGPPGCGKTLIAKAVANDAGASFIHIKGPELLNKYVGESEAEVRRIFTRARTNSPCILFFDEVDALTTRRDKEGGWVVERLLNQLLSELDGADQRQGVYVIGATNRVEVMDPALLRPGRFGKILYVPLPSADERVSILKTHAQSKPIAADVDFDTLACREECNNLSGADLAALVNEAVMAALEEKWDRMDRGEISDSPRLITPLHFERALAKIKPSVSEKQRRYYESLSQKYGAA